MQLAQQVAMTLSFGISPNRSGNSATGMLSAKDSPINTAFSFDLRANIIAVHSAIEARL